MATPTNPPASSSAPSTGPAATTTAPTARTSMPASPPTDQPETTVSGSPVEADTPRGDIRTGDPAALPAMAAPV